MPDIRIKKVEILRGRAREEAEKMGLSADDLVLISTTLINGCPPEYKLEKVVGDPVSFLMNRAKR